VKNLRLVLSRLRRLEDRRQKVTPQVYYYGWVPSRAVKTRRIVIVNRNVTASPQVYWCQFEIEESKE
jgi:hypothetical protein